MAVGALPAVEPGLAWPSSLAAPQALLEPAVVGVVHSRPRAVVGVVHSRPRDSLGVRGVRAECAEGPLRTRSHRDAVHSWAVVLLWAVMHHYARAATSWGAGYFSTLLMPSAALVRRGAARTPPRADRASPAAAHAFGSRPPPPRPAAAAPRAPTVRLAGQLPLEYCLPLMGDLDIVGDSESVADWHAFVLEQTGIELRIEV